MEELFYLLPINRTKAKLCLYQLQLKIADRIEQSTGREAWIPAFAGMTGS